MSNPASDQSKAQFEHRRRSALQQDARTETAHGTAHFLDNEQATAAGLLTNSLTDAPILMGRVANDPWKRCACLKGDGHILTIAPTGAGKTAGAVMPNHFYPGSALIIDPKGNVPVMGQRLRKQLGQQVKVLDPWGISGLPTTAINPFDLLDPSDENTIDDARVLAQSLVIGETGENSYWSDLARIVVTAFLVHIVTFCPPEQRNVQRLIDMAFSAMADFYDQYMPELEGNEAFDGWIKETTGLLQTAHSSEKIFSALFVTIQRSLDFLRSPRMKRALIPPANQAEFRFADLKRQALTIYLVIPPDRLETYGRWLRLMLSQAIIEVSRERKVPPYPVLFLMDEFAALQRLEVIETAIGLMRGYHMKLWPIVQDLSQLKQHYATRWTSFIANAGVLQVFNVNDVDTAEYISKLLGTTTAKVMGLAVDPTAQDSAQVVSRPLMTPDEVLRLPSDQQLLFYQGQYPYIVDKLKHWKDADLKEHFDPDPMRAD